MLINRKSILKILDFSQIIDVSRPQLMVLDIKHFGTIMVIFCTMLICSYRSTFNYHSEVERLFKWSSKSVIFFLYLFFFQKCVFFCPAPFQSIFWKDSVCLPYKANALIFFCNIDTMLLSLNFNVHAGNGI